MAFLREPSSFFHCYSNYFGREEIDRSSTPDSIMDFASSFSIDNILRNNPSSSNTNQVLTGPRALTLAERLAGM